MPPTETERRLYEATARGDGDGQVAAIAGEDLYLAVPQQGQEPLPVYDDPTAGGKCIPVLTRGMLPPWEPQRFFDRVSIEELAQDWPNDKWRLAINPGTPFAAYLSASPAHRAAWLRVRAQVGIRPGGLLVTHYAGPLHGPVAQGLACGAPLAVHHSVPWNELGTAFLDYSEDAETLRAQWSVADPVSWQQRFDQLLGGQFVPAETETALRARATASGGESGGESGGASEGGSTAGAGGASGADATAGDGAPPAVPELVDRYEERFRTDGLLPADGRVVSLVALDLAHAVGLVRWGLGARLCAPPQAEQAVMRVAARAQEVYGSWEEFAAGYALGRALAYDNGWFGPAYAETAHLHRVLTQDPASPWRGLSFG
ncbi:DUF1266 domain-containing protein [Streptomyces noursei]|uniref:DUF1266 domain-containing protein n=1 Tax=Streptomyces noursei TaxID=1971 RepID=UPI0016750554|nr:DUF1266 domain-containing protein [Streptomyces noursei]MCZ1018902.1 DUF1266 domain-containing protein [Streptomyces noursei]GGX22554.1 hypothetical protein GCM10010341_49840 [Streptomyces noursei]